MDDRKIVYPKQRELDGFILVWNVTGIGAAFVFRI